MTKQLIRAAATTVLGLSLTAGFAAADVSNTGPDSNNQEKSTVKNTLTVQNNNNLKVKNNNHQWASTGDAKVSHNTTGGDATSGDASNSNSFSASATINNSGGLGGSWSPSSGPSLGDINTTGPDSNNTISSHVTNTATITNNNNIKVSNSSQQSASSGDARVSDNTTGGSATSGNASNTNDTTVTLSVTN